MSAPRFVKPEPPVPYVVPDEDLVGFRAGVLSLAWDRPAEPFAVVGRVGCVFVARLVEVRTSTGRLRMSDARSTLHGTIVRGPDGVLSRITGVQTFLMPGVMVGGASGDLGLMLVPVDEP